MSSLLHLVIRVNGELFKTMISSGGLSEIFNPKIFQGDIPTIREYFDKCTNGEMESFAPFDGGLVVIDVDKKFIWDFQRTRYLHVLSPNVDHSWIHLDLLCKLGWIGEGLINTKHSLIVPYPQDGFSMKWYFEQQEKYRAQSAVTGTLFKMMKDAEEKEPRIPFKPLGWTIESFEAMEFGAVISQLICAGFSISAKDIEKWKEWVGVEIMEELSAQAQSLQMGY